MSELLQQMFLLSDWADIVAAAEERGITPYELVYEAVKNDLVR